MIREEHEMYAKLRAEFENEVEEPYLNTGQYLKWLEEKTVKKMMAEQVNGDDTSNSGLHLQNVNARFSKEQSHEVRKLCRDFYLWMQPSDYAKTRTMFIENRAELFLRKKNVR